MTSVKVECFCCGKSFFRSSRRFNEAIRNNWKQFCSPQCLVKNKFRQVQVCCVNCGKMVWKVPSEVLQQNCCSHSCAAIISNKLHPRNPGKVKICVYCGKNFKSRLKYCSTKCQHLDQVIPSNKLINLIKKFYKDNSRIPYKREFPHYHAAQARFGTWNRAIEAAGFIPNPVMFAKKYIAKDGDRCDSLAEKIIDDYLSRRKIKHLRSYPYPGKDGFTVDFKVGDKWIEFFGLSGQLKRYDQLKRRKLRLARNLGINLIEIYPRDLFPNNNLSQRII